MDGGGRSQRTIHSTLPLCPRPSCGSAECQPPLAPSQTGIVRMISLIDYVGRCQSVWFSCTDLVTLVLSITSMDVMSHVDA